MSLFSTDFSLSYLNLSGALLSGTQWIAQTSVSSL